MSLARPTVFIATAALCVALPPSAATALVQPEITNISCSLFLDDIADNPSDYLLYRSFAEGFLAAKVSSGDPAIDRPGADATMASAIIYCRSHPNDDFAAAVASALKKKK
jgi:hypothetical protein